jgi:CHASE2 domain-containing sensor protein
LLRLKDKGVRYWVVVAIIFFVAVTGSSSVYDYLYLSDARSWYFQKLLEIGPTSGEPTFVSIVLIEDDEYWKGDELGHKPVRRDYIAKIVNELASKKARVIALDFALRLPDPCSMAIPEDRRDETYTLIQAIVAAAADHHNVVLAAPIDQREPHEAKACDDTQGRYRRDSDIYQAYGLCKLSRKDQSSGNRDAREYDSEEMEKNTGYKIQISSDTRKNITCGYIELPFEPLALPLPLPVADGAELDSFAIAVARADKPETVTQLLERIGTNERYANYISAKKFKDYNAELSAQALFAADEEMDKKTKRALDQLGGKTVIVGAHWSTFALRRGPTIDMHPTPAGPMVGAEIHANYVEAILNSSRVKRPTPNWALRATEVFFSLVAAVAFALIPSLRGKMVGIFSLFVLLLFVQWSALHGFGVFFDAFVPLLGLSLHSLYDRLVLAPEVKRSRRKSKQQEATKDSARSPAS